MDYWEECVKESFEDAKIVATEDQISTVASWVEGAHENYGLATGQECIPNPMLSEIETLKAAHKRELSELKGAIYCYRESVASRRGVKVEDIYLDNGEVMYRRY